MVANVEMNAHKCKINLEIKVTTRKLCIDFLREDNRNLKWFCHVKRKLKVTQMD